MTAIGVPARTECQRCGAQRPTYEWCPECDGGDRT